MPLLLREAPVGELLRRLLIELPARELPRLTPARLAFGLLVAMAIVVVITFAKATGMIAIAQAIPEGLAWFATFDVGTYLDAIALIWLVAAVVQFRAAYHASRLAVARTTRWLLRCIGVLRGRNTYGARTRSHRHRPTSSRPNQEDDGAWPTPAVPAG